MKYYLIGIKGAGLSALALILNDLGYDVAGYDDEVSHQFTEDKLIKRGIKIYTGDESGIDENTIIIRSTAIKDEHKEMISALELDLKIYEYNEMLGKLSNMFDGITIAGCHGKTTTTSLMAHVINNIEGCNYLIGDGTGYANKENKKFILEACEYKRHFLVYEPTYAVITNIDLDHVDYYKSIDDVIEAYREYANNAEKMVIACGDDPYTRSLETNSPVFYYGIDDDNDILAKDVEYTDEGISFDVFVEENYYGHFDLPFYGKHMLLNSLAVIGVCYYERYEAKDVAKHLKTFSGAGRRFQEEKINDTIIVDDYAHHPEEIKVTLKAARQKYPSKKIIVVFQPHTFSRTQEFAEDIVEALNNNADYSYILDVFPAREKQEDFEGITSSIIIDNLKKGEEINDEEATKLNNHEDDVVIFMSPKEITNLMNNFKEYLNNK